MLNIRTYLSREEWFEHRYGIGGSDAAAVMGLSPYKTNTQLWEEKTGRRKPPYISDNPVVRYGTDAEKYLRSLFALDFPEYEVAYKECNAFFNSEKPFAHASLDGWLTERDTGRKGVLEIKTANITSGMLADRWKDQVPEHYYCQVLHYLLVTGWDFAVLKAQLKYIFSGTIERIETRHYKFDRSECEEDIKTLEAAERKFYQYVKEDKVPPLTINI